MRRTLFFENWWFGAALLMMPVGVAIAVVWNPLAAVALFGGILVALLINYGLLLSTDLHKIWPYCIAFLLIGYIFLDKGFAYLGIAPIFIGEITIGLSVLSVILYGGVRPAMRSRLAWLWLVFALWGAIQTVPYVRVYGIDALRDSVIWGYGILALIIAAFLIRSQQFSKVIDVYTRFLPWFLFWAPVAYILSRVLGDAVPLMPGTDMPMLTVKAGDMAVHVAGAAAFLLLALAHSSDGPRRKTGFFLKEWVLWLGWLFGIAVLGTANRGGLLANGIAILIVVCLRPMSVSKLGKVVLIGLLATLVFFSLRIQIEVKRGRSVSPEQFLANIQSIVGDEEDTGNLNNTKEWRLEWWNSIINYTFFGEYFWTGKGFGINLADDDGFQGTAWEGKLRSPHNGHFTILARAGVPGFTLWILLQATFAIGLLRAYFRALRASEVWWARLNLWILAYWIAFLVNASFDVSLEGPQQGICFWSLFGFGMAALEVQRRKGAVAAGNSDKLLSILHQA
jgi:hypothetical protein